MSDTETASWIAALERARTELETALSVDAPWQAPRGVAGDADWAGYETALAGNPVYRCWMQLSEAIEELRQQPRAEPSAGRRRISLRDVLEVIRSDAATPHGDGPQAPRSDAAQSALSQPPAAPEPPGGPVAEAGHAPPEAEEATVSFVIREPARSAPPPHKEASAARTPVPAASPEEEPGLGVEAQVVIVPRQR